MAAPARGPRGEGRRTPLTLASHGRLTRGEKGTGREGAAADAQSLGASSPFSGARRRPPKLLADQLSSKRDGPGGTGRVSPHPLNRERRGRRTTPAARTIVAAATLHERTGPGPTKR